MISTNGKQSSEVSFCYRNEQKDPLCCAALDTSSRTNPTMTSARYSHNICLCFLPLSIVFVVVVVVVVVAAVSIPMSMLNAVYVVFICSPVFFGCFGCVGYANSALICLRQSFVSRLAHISKPNQAAIVALTAHKFIPLLGGSTALKNKFLHLSLLFSIFQSEYDTHGTGVLPTIEPCTPLASTHTTTPTDIWQAKDLRPFLLSYCTTCARQSNVSGGPARQCTQK